MSLSEASKDINFFDSTYSICLSVRLFFRREAIKQGGLEWTGKMD